MSRVILVSNRLPMTVSVTEEGAKVGASSGGLAVGLDGLHLRNDTLWIGWPGDMSALDGAERERLLRELAARRVVPVDLSADEVTRFYDGFSNGVLWPLFHYQVQPLPVEVGDFEPYEAVNRRFADAVVANHRDGDLVWVHDYQLLAVPAMIREQVPNARIGFFLHIPFPSSELFRMLPQRRVLLEGMLGADLIGFHTATYLRHFVATVLRVVGATARVDRIEWQGREVHLGVFPMGVDSASFAGADAPEVRDEVAPLREGGDVRLLVGIDRLDYTKGIPGRLLAFERLLERHPEYRERVRLVQVAVPSRKDVDAYQEFRRRADELIGRIQGAFATPRWVPIHWIYRNLSRAEVVALYRAADVLLVTPIRDGMNLVAKEFVASRTDEDGVLVLSEFAGAAAELAEAVLVNPFDVDGSADAYHRALSMPVEERRRRMGALRRRVLSHDLERWWNGFLAALASIDVGPANPVAITPSEMVAAIADDVREAPQRVLLLDYDGTLVPYAQVPSAATPDPELLELLHALAESPGTDVHVVSGRDASSLEAWLGEVPVTLHAEHGFATRAPDFNTWLYRPLPPDSWRGPVLEILEDFRRRTPGSLVELKRAGMAWHYRMADAEFGPLQAKELHLHLTEILSNLPVEILPGSYVIEVRPYGLDKGSIVTGLLRDAIERTAFLAMGDDSTDEQMFAALPRSGVAIHIGPGPSRARVRLADTASARAFLRRLVADGAETERSAGAQRAAALDESATRPR